jgi:hypothetical protein
MQSVLTKWTAASTAQPRPQCGASRQSAPGHQPPVASGHQPPAARDGVGALGGPFPCLCVVDCSPSYWWSDVDKIVSKICGMMAAVEQLRSASP